MKVIPPLCTLFISASLALAADETKPTTPAEGAKPAEGKRPDPAAMFKKLDVNADGSLSKEEFNASPMLKEKPEMAEKAFTFKDADKDGKLTKEEFAKRREGQPGQKPPTK